MRTREAARRRQARGRGATWGTAAEGRVQTRRAAKNARARAGQNENSPIGRCEKCHARTLCPLGREYTLGIQDGGRLGNESSIRKGLLRQQERRGGGTWPHQNQSEGTTSNRNNHAPVPMHHRPMSRSQAHFRLEVNPDGTGLSWELRRHCAWHGTQDP